MTSSIPPFFGLILLALCLVGCKPASLVTLTDPETSQINNSTYIASADPGETIGQTFTTRRANLNSLILWVKTGKEGGELQVELYHTPGEDTPLFTQTIPFEDIPNGILTIHIPYGATHVSPHTGRSEICTGRSETCPYYILLRPTRGTLQVSGRAEDIYAGGQAFSGQTPLQADLAFTTTYDYDLSTLLADLRLSLPRLWLALPLLVMLFLPGWLLLEISGLKSRFDSGERLGLAVGLSLAIIPIAMLWSTTLGLKWGRTGLLISAALLLTAALWRISRRVTRPHAHMKFSANIGMSHRLRRSIIPILPLMLIFILTLGMRLVMSRDLSAPAWVDSIHHATITRLILEQGGFPSTYAPYININATEYHAGYHAVQAVFQWLSGLEAPEAMLLLGQVLNALIVFAMYLLAVTLTRQRRVGLAAAVIAGVFTPMPAYYTSWGRYTQLTGLLILPAGLALARLAIHSRKDEISCISTGAFAALACAGLFMVHYRVAGFLALLLVSYFLSRVRLNRLTNIRLVQNAALFAAVAATLALLLTLPWSWRAITQVFAPKAAVVGSSATQAFEGFAWDYLTAAWGLPAMILAGLGLLISLFRRPSLAFTLVSWTAALLLAANLSALHLPGGWFINTISVTIILFIPTAVLAGYALAQVYSLLLSLMPTWGKAPCRWVSATLGLAIYLLAARALLPILRPSTELFRSADRSAMDWIAANLPADATIVINPMYWGYGTYAGADGGYWITPLTGHKTIPPPVLYSLGDPLVKQSLHTMCDTVTSAATDPAALANYLRGHDLHYIYLGVRGGVLSPQLLQESDQFELLYDHDGAWVFKVR